MNNNQNVPVGDWLEQLATIEQQISLNRNYRQTGHPERQESALQMCLSLGEDVSLVLSYGRFIIGALGALVEPEYGEGSMKQFARTVGKKEKTVREYIAVVSKFGLETCIQFLTAGCFYAPMRVAMYFAPERDLCVKLLERIVSESLTTEQVEAIVWGKELETGDDTATPSDEKAFTLADLHAVNLLGVDLETGDVHLRMHPEDALALVNYVTRNLRVKFSVDPAVLSLAAETNQADGLTH